MWIFSFPYVWLMMLFLSVQHGYTTLDKVTAIEASNVGAGYGELAGAQANLLFCVKLVMPW